MAKENWRRIMEPPLAREVIVAGTGAHLPGLYYSYKIFDRACAGNRQDRQRSPPLEKSPIRRR